MENERLPIKFFAKREVDNLRVEPGGSSDLPKWVLDERTLARKSETFVNAVAAFKNEVIKKERSNSIIPLVFKTKIVDDATAKTHRKEVSNLFKTGTQNNILGLSEADEIIIKLEGSKDTDIIIERLKNIEKFAHALSCIDSIEEFNPVIVRSEKDVKEDYKVRLINFQNYEQNLSIRNYFEKSVSDLGLQLEKTHYTSDHIIYNIKSINQDALQLINSDEAFEAVYSIEPMPKYKVALDMGPTDDMEVDVLLPEDGKKYATVGILDNGIANIPHLKPWLSEESWTAYPEAYMKKNHGTFVSGVVVYGDLLEDREWVGTNGVKVLDACVFPDTDKEGISEDELIRNIQEAIKSHYKEVKVWNLSISITTPVDETSFSDFAVALDDIQEKYNVLICKSAGNCSNFTIGHPKGKIHQGADSIRSIVVGSIAHKKSNTDLADVDNPSPFTRIGRGPSYIIKPEVVHYGGNAGLNEQNQLVTTGVKSFGLDGSLHQSVGTSYSTPRIAALAAGLYQEMEEEFDPLLIKTLMVHSASYSELLKIPNVERVNQVGFGKPQSVRNILYNSPHEATLILKDEISKGEYIDIMDFPMPDCLAEGDYYSGQIIVTLVYNPILDSSQRAEYSQSNIDIKMGTYDTKKDRDTTRRNILNPVGRDNSKNLLLESAYSKTKMKNNQDDFALKERLLIQYGDKYYPVKKYAVDLSEMTEANQLKYTTKDKKWYLYLKGLFRDHIETKAQLEETDLTQDFCLMVTIKDPTGTKPVYDQVNQKLDEYNFWHNNIKLSSEVTLRT
ncbi:S8 family peptidase [Virgibacillus sp. SK37]|uniref:S8 family peptidase n=1 Tax=Virgibacillus sp. SK37 TaxID=403957 RepID=UPI0011A190BC|nr:S8 family peptidase [Virgibacillus sp. SK37]